jgi:(2Fe-2S) ferredoxin
MEKLKAHLFICTNSPDKVGRCGNKNSEQMRRSLKERCQAEAWGKNVRINSSGCLGQCEQGIAAVIYPQETWFLNLKDSDENFLFQAVKEAVEKNK